MQDKRGYLRGHGGGVTDAMTDVHAESAFELMAMVLGIRGLQ